MAHAQLLARVRARQLHQQRSEHALELFRVAVRHLKVASSLVEDQLVRTRRHLHTPQAQL